MCSYLFNNHNYDIIMQGDLYISDVERITMLIVNK